MFLLCFFLFFFFFFLSYFFPMCFSVFFFVYSSCLFVIVLWLLLAPMFFVVAFCSCVFVSFSPVVVQFVHQCFLFLSMWFDLLLLCCSSPVIQADMSGLWSAQQILLPMLSANAVTHFLVRTRTTAASSKLSNEGIPKAKTAARRRSRRPGGNNKVATGVVVFTNELCRNLGRPLRQRCEISIT